jgi:hypothetical protein
MTRPQRSIVVNESSTTIAGREPADADLLVRVEGAT